MGVIILCLVSFFIYTAIYNKADNEARSIYENNTNIYQVKNTTYVFPSDNLIDKNERPTSDNDFSYPDTAIIFYPGAKVEPIAYLPLLNKIAEEDKYLCILVDMPFNMAIFNANAADSIISNLEGKVDNIYISGHSMGGAMASSYASKNSLKVDGLILMGAYIYGNYSDEDALTIYGSLNQSVEDNINYEKNIIEIDGGNHANFGNYGHQKGDAISTITREQQQEQTVVAIKNFIENRK